MRVVLSTPVAVERVAVFAEMAWLERRPELGLLCGAARDAGGRITTALVQSVLPGLADAGARNVIAWCTTLALCDRQGALTQLGEGTAEQGEAPVPEQGVFDLWLAYHPLMGRRVLSADRLASTSDARFEAIAPLPFEPARGRVFRSVARPEERMIVRDLPGASKGALPRPTGARCRLRWTLDFDAGRDHWQLDGTLEPKIVIKHDAESDGIDLRRLADIWGAGPLASLGRWDATARRLMVALDGLDDKAQESFEMPLTVPKLDVPERGSYEAVTIEAVPIGPSTSAVAQRWARGRLERRLGREPRYRSRDEVRRVFSEGVVGTPLEPWAPTLPAHVDLIGRSPAGQPERYWSLAAPVDLAPQPLSEAELGVCAIDASVRGAS